MIFNHVTIDRPQFPSRLRLGAALLCLVMVGLCFSYAFFRESLTPWWRQYGGGVPYVMFFITFFCAVYPRPRNLMTISIAVTLATCGLEFLQLWQPHWLTQFRSTRLGAALLGTTFTWMDLPPYFIGGVMGYGAMAILWNAMGLKSSSSSPS